MLSVKLPAAPVRFLSNGEIWIEIMELLSRAKSEILMIFPWITYDELIRKLVELKTSKPELRIKILTGIGPQSGELHRESVRKLDEAGIQVRTVFHPFLHAKSVCIDREVLITGSMNASFSGAQRNFECAIVTSTKTECDKFSELFSKVWYEALFHGAILREGSVDMDYS